MQFIQFYTRYPKKPISEQRPEGSEKVNHVDIERLLPGKGTASRETLRKRHVRCDHGITKQSV